MDKTFADEQIIHRGLVQKVKHPLKPDMKLMKNPIHFSNMETDIYRYPPLLGENTYEILDELGYSKEDIETFKHQNII